jgi:UDP-N-acetylmuramoyl-L-alanyl-D-glutamate--2,6-diaminopimelate ligase
VYNILSGGYIKSLIPQWLKNQFHLLLAVMAVVRYGYPAKKLNVIGVTGTDGKTTTATLIYHCLKTAGYKVALISSVAAYIGAETLDTGFHVTTPDPRLLQKLIQRLVREGCTHLVLEVTSHGLDQYRLFGTNIRYAVITNVTHEHLDYHKTYSRYLKTKAKILNHAFLAVLNADDASFSLLTPYLKPKTRLLTYSLSKMGVWSADISNRFHESFNQANALAAVTLVSALKVNHSFIYQALKTFPGVTGRLETIPNVRQLRLIVDFAHTPNALEKALTALRLSASGNLITVYGAAGERDVTKRPLMGEIGSRIADEVVLTAEDPRTERVADIIHQIKSGVKVNHGHVHAIIDRQQAINFAVNQLAASGDTVAVFGKGHERSINLDGKHELAWSDQAAIIKALNLPRSV